MPEHAPTLVECRKLVLQALLCRQTRESNPDIESYKEDESDREGSDDEENKASDVDGRTRRRETGSRMKMK
jgi:hypothetical protein